MLFLRENRQNYFRRKVETVYRWAKEQLPFIFSHSSSSFLPKDEYKHRFDFIPSALFPLLQHTLYIVL